jgi:hypothetical protein
MAKNNKRDVPKFNEAGDLLVTAAIEWRKGYREDALILAAGALNSASMEDVAIALHLSNNAAQENTSIEELLQSGGDGEGIAPGEDEIIEELPVDRPPEAVQEPPGDGNIKQEVSRVLNKLIKRENADVDHSSPFTGPGGDAGEDEEDDSARHLDEDEPTDEGDIGAGDEDEDEDAEGLVDEPDPADPKAMAEHPAEAAELENDDNIVEVDDEVPEDGTSNLGNKLRQVSDVEIPVEARAAINRISYTGTRADRELAAEFARSYATPKRA